MSAANALTYKPKLALLRKFETKDTKRCILAHLEAC